MIILQINSSARPDDSQPTKLDNALMERIREDNPGTLQNGLASVHGQIEERMAA